jgi:hypothetical protein
MRKETNMTAAEMIAAAKLPVTDEQRAERQEALRQIVDRVRSERKARAKIMTATADDLARACSL